MGDFNVPHRGWWQAKFNPLYKTIQPDHLNWDNKTLMTKVRSDAPRKSKLIDGEMAYWYFNRSFVLDKIRRMLIKPLQSILSREEMHDLLDEAYDFDLQAYKQEFYQAHSDDDSGD